MENPLTMYALDINGNVIATKEAVADFRLSGIRIFFKEVQGAHTTYVRSRKSNSWHVTHGVNDSWYSADELDTESLPKPFQMYLMLLGE